MALMNYLNNHTMFFLLSIGFFGLCMGSFLNVVIYRLPIMLQKNWDSQCRDFLQIQSRTHPGQPSIFNLSEPRSRCPHCQHLIHAVENIPIVSFIFLGGKCAHCKNSISWRYPVIEALTAFLSVLLAWHFGIGIKLLFALVFTWSLLCLTIIDTDKQILPDNITLPLLWLGLLANVFNIFVATQDAIIGAVVGYLFLWTIAWIFERCTGRQGMGQGDFKLLAALGAWFGWQLLPFIIFLSSFVGALIGIILIISKRQNRQTPIPFGPYLAGAGWIALLGGNELTQLFLQHLKVF